MNNNSACTYCWQQFNTCQAHSKQPVTESSVYPSSDGGWLSWLPIQVAPHERIHCVSWDSRPVPKSSQTLVYGFITEHRSHYHLHTRWRFPSRWQAPWHRSAMPAHIRFSGPPAPPHHLQRSQKELLVDVSPSNCQWTARPSKRWGHQLPPTVPLSLRITLVWNKNLLSDVNSHVLCQFPLPGIIKYGYFNSISHSPAKKWEVTVSNEKSIGRLLFDIKFYDQTHCVSDFTSQVSRMKKEKSLLSFSDTKCILTACSWKYVKAVCKL